MTVLMKDFRQETDASLQEAKAVVEMATEEEIANAQEYGVEEIEHLLDLHRNPDLWDRLGTMMERSGQWWRIDYAAKVLGVSTHALRRHLRHSGSDYRKFESEGAHRDKVGPRRSVVLELEAPRQSAGTVTSW
jgi:hypothetical protein